VGPDAGTISVERIFGTLTVTAAAKPDGEHTPENGQMPEEEQEESTENEENASSNLFLLLMKRSGFVRIYNDAKADIEIGIFNADDALISTFTINAGRYRGAALELSDGYHLRRMDTGEEIPFAIHAGKQITIRLD